MRSYTFLSLLLLTLSGCSHRGPAAGGGAPPVAMGYRDFADVQTPTNRTAPLQIVTSREAGSSGSMASFVVTAPWHGFAPGQTFRDGVHVAADVAAHKGSAAKLKAELHAWNLLLKDSPVIVTQADLEPHCEAHLSGGASTVALSQTFTPTGSQKFAQFTKAHTGQIVGIIVDGHVLSAPLIVEPVTDGRSEISGGFSSLNEARVLADRLNEASGR